MAIEEYGCDSRLECERPTKRETFESVSERMEESWESDCPTSHILHEDRVRYKRSMENAALAFFHLGLLTRAFAGWKELPCERNLPMKTHFLH